MGRLTPIERAIAGEPQDRRKRWEQRMADRGYRRMTLYVPEDQVPVIDALKLALREMDADDRFRLQDGLHQFFSEMAEAYEEDLHHDPSLAEETTIEEEIAFLRRAAEVTHRDAIEGAHRSEQSERGRALDGIECGEDTPHV